MEYLIYITKNLVTGEIYGGKHIGDRNDGYIGSGPHAFLPALRKYGKENFERRYLKLKIKDEDHMNKLEIRLIRLLKFWWKDGCYNVHVGGGGGYPLKYSTPEFRLEVNRRITEGKLKQYANGQTAYQLEGRKKQKETLKDTFKNNVEFRERFSKICKENGPKISKTLKSRIHTKEDLEKIKRFHESTMKHFKFEIISPDGIKLAEEVSITSAEIIRKYKIEECVVIPMVKFGEYVVKQRRCKTKHNFPIGSIFKCLGFINPEHKSEAVKDFKYVSKKIHYNFEIILPDNTVTKVDDVTPGILRNTYSLADPLIKQLVTTGEFKVERKQANSTHNFPLHTILKLNKVI